MEAISTLAPVMLALSVSLDAVATLGLVLMSYQGPFLAAMLPRTGDTRLDIAAGLGDVLALALLRGGVVMLPLLGLSATLPWLCAAVTAVGGMTAWLAAKAALLCQLAPLGARTLEVAATGVALHVPAVVAAEALGMFMGWFLLLLVWVNRRVMQQPAAGDPIIALQARTAAALAQQRLAVQQWVMTQAEPPQGEGPELTAPLLPGGGAAGAGVGAGAGADLEGGGGADGWCDADADGDDIDAGASFVSARSRQASAQSAASWATASSALPGAPSAASSQPRTR